MQFQSSTHAQMLSDWAEKVMHSDSDVFAKSQEPNNVCIQFKRTPLCLETQLSLQLILSAVATLPRTVTMHCQPKWLAHLHCSIASEVKIKVCGVKHTQSKSHAQKQMWAIHCRAKAAIAISHCLGGAKQASHFLFWWC